MTIVDSSSVATPPDAAIAKRRGFFAQGRQLAFAVLATLVVVVAGTLFGVSQYASARRMMIQDAETSAARFDVVFREAAESRLEALRLGVEIAARNDAIAEALKQHDRAELAHRAIPLFEQVLKPEFGVIVFDFQSTEGTMVFRAHQPAQFGDDVSHRPMVIKAQKARTESSGLEIGRSGPEFRAMAPVFVGDTMVGSLELGSPVTEALSAGRQATGLDFAFAMDRAQAESIDRIAQQQDLIVGDSVYFAFSSPEVRDLLASVAFSPTSAGAEVVKTADRQIFLKTFPVLDVGHRPVTRVTLVKDLTAQLDARRISIIISTSLAVLAVLVVVWISLFQFQALRMRLEQSFAGRLQGLRTKARAYDAIRQSQVDAQAWKVGFLSELVLLVKDPLTAVDGALAVAGRSTDATPGNAAEETRRISLAFAAREVRRLSAAVDDQASMIALRDDLRRVEPGLVDLESLIADLALKVGATSEVADLPTVLGDRSLLESALRSAIQALQRTSESIPVTIAARSEPPGVAGNISVPGAWPAGPPSLDQGVPFGATPAAERDALMPLARLTFERFGGTLDALDGEDGRIGFTFSLAAA